MDTEILGLKITQLNLFIELEQFFLVLDKVSSFEAAKTKNVIGFFKR